MLAQVVCTSCTLELAFYVQVQAESRTRKILLPASPKRGSRTSIDRETD